MTLEYRNVAEADVTVYPVDLMRLYLTRRNLDGDRRDRPGGHLPPVRERKVKLGDGADYDDKTRPSTSP